MKVLILLTIACVAINAAPTNNTLCTDTYDANSTADFYCTSCVANTSSYFSKLTENATVGDCTLCIADCNQTCPTETYIGAAGAYCTACTGTLVLVDGACVEPATTASPSPSPAAAAVCPLNCADTVCTGADQPCNTCKAGFLNSQGSSGQCTVCNKGCTGACPSGVYNSSLPMQTTQYCEACSTGYSLTLYTEESTHGRCYPCTEGCATDCPANKTWANFEYCLTCSETYEKFTFENDAMSNYTSCVKTGCNALLEGLATSCYFNDTSIDAHGAECLAVNNNVLSDACCGNFSQLADKDCALDYSKYDEPSEQPASSPQVSACAQDTQIEDFANLVCGDGSGVVTGTLSLTGTFTVDAAFISALQSVYAAALGLDVSTFFIISVTKDTVKADTYTVLYKAITDSDDVGSDLQTVTVDNLNAAFAAAGVTATVDAVTVNDDITTTTSGASSLPVMFAAVLGFLALFL